MTYFILSSLDRYARENGKKICGPPEAFIRETLGDEDFYATNDFNFTPPHGSNVVLCGPAALRAWTGKEDLNAQRGFVHAHRMCHTVATWLPVDCVDVKNYEPETFDEEDEEDAAGDNKDSAPTSRQNYRFWFRSDVRKLVRTERRTTVYAGNSSLSRTSATDSQETIRALEKIQSYIVVDIETHPPTNTLQCFSFAAEDGPVYTVPIYDYRGRQRCDVTYVMALLVEAMQRCVTVGHNISFDLGFMAHYHAVPWGPRLEDTMVQHHRVYPESEKSLAHVISYWINAPYHKDSAGTFTPYNEQQYQKLLAYNAADVATTRAVWLAQRDYIALHPELAASVRAANASIEPYLRAGFTGFEFDELARTVERRRVELTAGQVGAILNILVGHDILPTSPLQLSEYLYKELRYPVTDTTDKGAPSTAADTLYKLLLRNPNNAALKAILKLRDLNKQSDMLQFKPLYRTEKR